MTLRATRALTLASIALAVVVHAWLRGAAGLAGWPGPAAFALGAIAAARWHDAALGALLGAGPLWQLAAYAVTGGTDIHVTMSWLAAVAGAVAARDRAAAWGVPWPWTPLLAAWALAIALTWPVVVARELDFTPDAVGADTVNGVFAGRPEQVGAFVVLGSVAQLVALLAFDVWGRHSGGLRTAFLRVLGAGVLAACAVAIYQATADIAFLSREPWPRLGRAAGTLFDANALGALAAIAGPILATAAWGRGVMGGGLAAAAWLALSLGAIVASGSRTSFAAGLAGTGVLGLLILRDAGGTRRDRVRVALAVGGLAVLAGAIALAGASSRHGSDPVSRLAATAAAAAKGGLAGVVRVGWDRDGYGPTSMAMIADHPWVGVGAGAFGTVVGDYSRATIGTVLPPDNAQNWWRHHLAELGLLGGLAGLAASLLVAAVVLRRVVRGAPVADIGVLGAATAIGAMALVSPPTQHPVLQVLVAVVLAAAVLPTADDGPPAPSTQASRVAGWTAWGLALACTAALLVDGVTASRPPLRAVRFGFVYSHGFSPLLPPAPGQVDGTQRRWMAARGVAVVPPAGRALVVRTELPHGDLDARPVTVRIGQDRREACVHEARTSAPFECRLALEGRWTRVDVTVSRTWTPPGGGARGALVTAWYEP